MSEEKTETAVMLIRHGMIDVAIASALRPGIRA
jgi:hypothetical protein